MHSPTTLNVFQAVRQGDIETVRYLVEVQAEALQQHDEWDATPLYYASYAGNKELVKYLLSAGARCEEKTFDGERCLYAALNDDVRHTLLDEGFKRAGARGHDLFLDFVGKAFNVPEAYPDLTVSFEEETVYAHKFLLAVRAPAIGSLFGDGWKQQQTHHTVASSSNPLALQALLRWFYTCRLDVAFDAVSACLELCQQVQLTELVEEANLALHSEAGNTLQHLPFRGSSLVVEPFREVAKQQLQDCLENVVIAACSGLVERSTSRASANAHQDLFFDLRLVLGSRSCLCHRSFMSRRSDYFSTMLGSNFQEGSTASGDILEIQVADVQPEVLYAALRWVYTDRVNADMPAEQLLQVMQYADRALMEGLKGRCAMLLHPHVTQDSALLLLQQALALDSDRLADTCVRCIAQHLLSLVRDPLFNQLVRDSAESVQNREDVDSVPIIDDIRYHVTLLHGDGELSDDDEDTEVLDPAQLAMVYADQQTKQQPQPEALQMQLQLPSLQHLQPEQQQQHIHADGEQPSELQSDPDSAAAQHSLPQQQVRAEHLEAHQHAVSAEQVQGWRQGDHHKQEEDDYEEELICMDDPRFASLSERKQKLMALEEILLNTGIEG
ncbi:TPA: Ankyrin repeat and BTB/POZ domain-containing protein 1 [Trebouxia sp. C0005]